MTTDCNTWRKFSDGPDDDFDTTCLNDAVRIAERVRDQRADDAGAARVLDHALATAGKTRREEFVYALLVRMELAEQLGECGLLQALRHEVQRVNLAPPEREVLERRLPEPRGHE